MIWLFDGATDRVDRVVLLGYGTQAVTGLSTERVTDLSGVAGGDCPSYFYDPSSPEGVAARGAVERALGRSVDAFSGTYSLGRLSLPSATSVPGASPSVVPPGFDPGVYDALGLRFSPAGVEAIDPSQVVSTTPAERYDVLPYGFGLAQLVSAGALEVVDGGFLYTFRIARAIPRFPAGLHGAHLVRFVLGRGVPMPEGSAGHSCVISEETGLPLVNASICSAIFGD
jgi:hypothetical protein